MVRNKDIKMDWWIDGKERGKDRERQIFRWDDEWVVRWRQGEREIGKDSFIDGLMEG